MISPPGPPVVTIRSPAVGERVLRGDTVRLHASVSDSASGGAFVVRWFAGESLIATGVRGDYVAAEVGPLVLTAEATNGAGFTGRDRVALEVLPNSRPFVSSVTMQPPDRVFDSDSVTLIARAVDLETGVTSPRVAWRSDLDGDLGGGDTLHLPPASLSAGTHRVTALVFDGQGLVDSLWLTATVVPAPSRLLWSLRQLHADASRSLLALRPDGVILAAMHTADSTCVACLVAVGPGGVEQWRRSIGVRPPSNHSGALTVTADNGAFVMDFDGNGYAFGPDGTLLWSTPISGFDPHGRFALAPDGGLYVAGRVVGSNDGMLTRLDPSTGGVQWQLTAPGAGNVWAGPYVAPDGRIATVLNGYMTWVAADGTQLQQGPDRLLPTYSRGAMIADGTTYVADSRVVAVAPDGTERWRLDLGLPCCAARLSEPVVDAAGIVYVADTDFVTAIRPGDQTRVWTRALPSLLTMPWLALTADGGLLVNAGYELIVLDASTGNPRWAVELANPVASSIAVAPAGVIYSLASDGRLLALQGDAPLAEDAPWPAWRAGNRRTSSLVR